MIEQHLSLLVKSIFVENLALAFFLGMCTYLAVSRRVETATGLGIAVIGEYFPTGHEQSVLGADNARVDAHRESARTQLPGQLALVCDRPR